jgi:hypothetical protein
MDKNSAIKSKKTKQKVVSERHSDPAQIQKSGNLEIKQPAPDYSSMYEAIKKIGNPVSFESLKEFYGKK